MSSLCHNELKKFYHVIAELICILWNILCTFHMTNQWRRFSSLHIPQWEKRPTSRDRLHVYIMFISPSVSRFPTLLPHISDYKALSKACNQVSITLTLRSTRWPWAQPPVSCKLGRKEIRSPSTLTPSSVTSQHQLLQWPLTPDLWSSSSRHCVCEECQTSDGILGILGIMWDHRGSETHCIALQTQGIESLGHKVLFLKDLKATKLSYHSEIWQVTQQHCCRVACQISEWSYNS